MAGEQGAVIWLIFGLLLAGILHWPTRICWRCGLKCNRGFNCPHCGAE